MAHGTNLKIIFYDVKLNTTQMSFSPVVALLTSVFPRVKRLTV